MNDDTELSNETTVVLGTGPLGRATATALARAGKNTVVANQSGTMKQALDQSSLMATK